MTCCYLATTHRKRDKSTRGIGGQSERNLVDEADTMNSLALRVETAAGPATAPVGSLALPSPEKLKFGTLVPHANPRSAGSSHSSPFLQSRQSTSLTLHSTLRLSEDVCPTRSRTSIIFSRSLSLSRPIPTLSPSRRQVSHPCRSLQGRRTRQNYPTRRHDPT